VLINELKMAKGVLTEKLATFRFILIILIICSIKDEEKARERKDYMNKDEVQHSLALYFRITSMNKCSMT